MDNQIKVSIESIMNAIRLAGQDKGVMLKTLQRANKRLSDRVKRPEKRAA